MSKDNNQEPEEEEEEYSPWRWERESRKANRREWEELRQERRQGDIGASIQKGNILEDVALSLRDISYILRRIEDYIRVMR